MFFLNVVCSVLLFLALLVVVVGLLERAIDGERPKFWFWLVREWTLLRRYRRRHVSFLIQNCTVDGSLNANELTQTLATVVDPFVRKVDGEFDTQIVVQGCHFRGPLSAFEQVFDPDSPGFLRDAMKAQDERNE